MSEHIPRQSDVFLIEGNLFILLDDGSDLPALMLLNDDTSKAFDLRFRGKVCEPVSSRYNYCSRDKIQTEVNKTGNMFLCNMSDILKEVKDARA